MTCNECENKHKKSCSTFPKSVIEIDNPETITLLRKVVVPASLGDDTTIPAAVGKYRNVVLHYEANRHTYLYSSDGIPTYLETEISKELLDRIDALEDGLEALQQEVEDMKNNPDVVDIVGTYADLQAYDTSKLSNNDIIRVLVDDTHGGNSTYYRWDSDTSEWTYVGEIQTTGAVKTLTTADYNWNKTSGTAQEPYDSLAPWLLDYGLYRLGENMVFVRASDILGSVTKKEDQMFSVTYGSSSAPKVTVELGTYFLSTRDPENPMGSYGNVVWYNEDGTRNRYSCFIGDDLVNDLSDPDNSRGVLSAKTGKALEDNIGDLSSLTTTDKTSLVNALNEVAGSGGLTVVQSTGQSTTDVMSQKAVTDALGVAGEGLTTLSYGSSTWNDFISAYNAGKIVYCRASSNANPATGNQTRMAFMAYINNPTTPTEVEFQYVRSVVSKTAAQQTDQVYVYTLTNTSGGTWTVETRNVASKIVAGTNMTSSYSNGTLTLNCVDAAKPHYEGYMQEYTTTANTGTVNLHEITVSEDGVYLVTLSGWVNENGVTHTGSIYPYIQIADATTVYANTQTIISDSTTNTNEQQTLSATAMFSLSANDKVYLRFGQSNTAAAGMKYNYSYGVIKLSN